MPGILVIKKGDFGLCDPCKQIQDLDLLLGSVEPVEHHRSWTTLCRSAENGCKMCSAFVQCQELKRFSDQKRPLARNFDVHMTWPETQLTLRRHGINSLFILQQKALFRHPFREVVNVWFELYPCEDNPLGSLFTARPVYTCTRSENSFNLLDKWVKRCKEDHPQCSWPSNNTLPTRVIDVGSENEDPFLFESCGTKGEWLTLSHCWGGGAPLQTTSETLQEHKSSIPMSSLPETFRDAILLTRRLGYRYIWIDSLCILQNLHEDWTSESSQMFRVYANAAINLSASAARNPTDGIFRSGNQQKKFSAPLTTLMCRSASRGIEGELGVRLQMGGNGPFVLLPEEPIHRRAWVLQESILSPRKIDFASTQLYWECRTALYTERYPDSEDGTSFLRASGRELYQMAPRKCNAHPDLNHPTIACDLMSWWYDMLYESFRYRGLTVDSDVFPALAGVAEEVSHRSGFHYKAGLWLEDIHRGLLWQTTSSMIQSEDDGCPSWSWASAKLPERDRRLALNHYAAEHRATVINVDIDFAGENEYGRLRSGKLNLECHIRSFCEWTGTSLPIYNGHGGDFESMRMATRYLSPDKAVAYITPPVGRALCTTDVRPDNTESCHSAMLQRGAICAQIATFRCLDRRINVHAKEEEGGWKNVVYGLILEPVKDLFQVYRRIGIVEIAAEDGLADGWPKQGTDKS